MFQICFIQDCIEWNWHNLSTTMNLFSMTGVKKPGLRVSKNIQLLVLKTWFTTIWYRTLKKKKGCAHNIARHLLLDILKSTARTESSVEMIMSRVVLLQYNKNHTQFILFIIIVTMFNHLKTFPPLQTTPSQIKSFPLFYCQWTTSIGLK